MVASERLSIGPINGKRSRFSKRLSKALAWLRMGQWGTRKAIGTTSPILQWYDSYCRYQQATIRVTAKWPLLRLLGLSRAIWVWPIACTYFSIMLRSDRLWLD